MRPFLLIFALCLVTLLRLPGGQSFVVVRRTNNVASPTVLPMAPPKKPPTGSAATPAKTKETKNLFQDMMARIKKDPVREILRVLITGSPDGIMMIGKPQYNWSTGKPMTSKEMASKTIQKKKK